MADDAGALLVRSGLVPPTALDAARIAVASHGGTIGEQLVASGIVADDALTDFYRSRLLVPQVNPNTLARLPRRVINAIPADMAVELRAIPVSLDDENTLTVAMSDPSDSHAVDEIAFFTGTYVVRAVATQMQIAWCLAHYYGHVTPLGERLLQPTGGHVELAPGAFPRAATPPAGLPEPAAVPAMPRVKGDTTRINATRHRAIAPVTGPIEVPRPLSGELDLPRATPPSTPVDESAVPEPAPRSRSISGEIRVPSRRAASIRPPMPEPLADADDESGPVITMEVDGPDEDPTGPQKLPPRRKQKPNPPELAERAGEVSVSSAPDRAVSQDEPRIIIEEEPPPPSSGVVVREGVAPDSEPVLLQRRRESDAPTGQHAAVEPAVDEVSGEVVVLDRPLARSSRAVSTPREVPRSARPEKRTVVGIGALPAVTRHVRDTDAGSIPGIFDDAPTGPEDATRVDGFAAPPSDEITDETLAPPPAPSRVDTPNDDTGPIAPPAPARPQSQPIVSGSITTRRPTTDGASNTAVMSAVELDEAIPDRASEVVPAHLARRVDHDDVDDGWGPPGTTIPPPLLGAIPGIEGRDSGLIPVPDIESAPLIVAPPAPPEAALGDPARLARALEEATSRSLALLQELERATSRDDVIQLMMRHLAATHRRAGCFSIKNGELGVFAMLPPPEVLSVTSLRLDRPSTLQDVVGTRLPYRGPMHDDASRNFLAAALGACPPEILLVPVVVRERVVGVLFGEHRLQHAFDDQLALAARAAGLALERILKTKRG